MTYAEYMSDTARSCAIVAHRGVWNAAPENSLLAIRRAIDAGYDVVEIDVRRAADGDFVILHDKTLERMAGIDGQPETMTLAELSTVALRDRDGGPENAVTSEMLPSLKQVFELTRDRIFIHLDIKDRTLIPQVIAYAQAMGVDRQVDVWADIRTVDDLNWARRTILEPGIPFVARARLEAPDADVQIDLVLALKPLICEVSFKALEQVRALKDRFRAEGITLWANTLNEVSSGEFNDRLAGKDPGAVWGRMIDAGISAIQTDEMEGLRNYLKTRQAA
ncbi:glycerophosphodiester phosphodiesterase family protein [Agrobacterium sp. SHOUNA12C]|nr:glycerophosphodiester phosphodiesterase family protein [Agrobacterium sp. BETTINA12B]MCJ9755121.1 glycerophosphodiester phosphodiesterase family protein [Agrobacterium sp. SHOUNA12C]